MASNSGEYGLVSGENVLSPDARAARRVRDEAEAAAREAQRVRDETEEAEDAAAALQVARADAEALRAAASIESAMQEASEQDDLVATEPASDAHHQSMPFP